MPRPSPGAGPPPRHRGEPRQALLAARIFALTLPFVPFCQSVSPTSVAPSSAFRSPPGFLLFQLRSWLFALASRLLRRFPPCSSPFPPVSFLSPSLSPSFAASSFLPTHEGETRGWRELMSARRRVGDRGREGGGTQRPKGPFPPSSEARRRWPNGRSAARRTHTGISAAWSFLLSSLLFLCLLARPSPFSATTDDAFFPSSHLARCFLLAPLALPPPLPVLHPFSFGVFSCR